MKTTLDRLIEKEISHNKILFILIIIGIIILIICKCIFHIKQLDSFIFIILMFLVTIFLGGNIQLHRIKNLKKESNLKFELEKQIIYYPEDCILTEHYLIIDFSKKYIFNYNDIALIYMKNEFTYMGIKKYLWIVLKTGKKYSIWINKNDFFNEYDFEYNDLFEIFVKKNNNILIERTEENKRILLEKYNIKI